MEQKDGVEYSEVTDKKAI